MSGGTERRDRLEMHLLATAGAVRRAYEARLASLGLNLTESGLLQFLHFDGAMTQAALAQRLHIGKMSAGAAVKSLHTRDLVTRTRDPEDGRAWLIDLSPSGVEMVQACIAVDTDVVAVLRAGLDRSEQRRLRTLLAKILTNAGRIDDPQSVGRAGHDAPT